MERLDFVGIGVQKAATSWLFTCLHEHPAVRASTMTNSKELSFFNDDWELGYRWLHRGFDFGDWLCGEFTPRYFHHANVPDRIRMYHPEIKLLLVLREPVERALSQHRHELRRLRLPAGITFRDALEENPSYLEQGRYATHLERWRDNFADSQILVLLYDDVCADPAATMRRVFTFLGIDDGFHPPSLQARVNASVSYRSSSLARVTGRLSVTVQRRFGDPVVKALVGTRLPTVIRRMNSDVVSQALPDETMVADLRDRFADEVERLEKMIDRDLSAWK
jgi:Sulfotransferase domain